MKLPCFLFIAMVYAGATSRSYAQNLPPSSGQDGIALPPVVVEAQPKTSASPPKTSQKPLPLAKPIAPGASIESAFDAGEAGPASTIAVVSTINADQLGNWGIQRVDALVRAIPNANISGFGDGRSSLITLRGVGPLTDPFAPDDNSVVTYIDGVPQLLFAGDASLFDLDHVDVVKGPQGTRFGLNSTGGAIDYVTRKPTERPDGELRTELGDNGHWLTEAAGSKSSVDGTAAARVAVRYSTIEGFVPNLGTGHDVGARDIAAARSIVVLKPSPDAKITMTARAENDDRTFPYFVLRDAAGSPIEFQSIDGSVDRSQAGGSFIIERALESSVFTSMSGYSDLSINSLVDDTDGLLFARITGLPAAAFAFDSTRTDWKEDQQLWSQEFRWAARKGAPIDWVTGITFIRNDFEADYRNTHAIFAVNNGFRRNDLTTTSFGAYGEVTVPVGAASRLTGGLRYNHDRKTYESRYVGTGFPGTVGFFAESGGLDFDYVTGRMVFAHDLGPRESLIASISRGEKSGGFPRLVTNAAVGVETAPFRSTTIMAYEAGYRAMTSGGRGTLDATVFFNDVADEQLFVFDAVSFNFVPDNIDTQIFGGEIKVDWQATPEFCVSGGLGVTAAEIKDPSPRQRAAGAQSGNRPPNTPDLTAFVRLDYRKRMQLPGLEHIGPTIIASLGWNYVGERAANVANDFFLNDLHLVDARLGLSSSLGWQVYLFGRNLLDVMPELAGNYVGAGVEAVVPERGRVTGVGLLATW